MWKPEAHTSTHWAGLTGLGPQSQGLGGKGGHQGRRLVVTSELKGQYKCLSRRGAPSPAHGIIGYTKCDGVKENHFFPISKGQRALYEPCLVPYAT